MRLAGSLKKGLLAGMLLAAALAALGGQAAAIPTEFIVNGEFGTNASPSLASWTTSGTANARASTDAINTSTGNAGFNTFFSSAFAVLGDATGAISGGPQSGVFSIHQDFVLPATVGALPVIAPWWSVTISFRTAFDGERSSGAAPDVFSATLTGVSLAYANTLFTHTHTTTGIQLENDIFSTALTGLLPGTYRLKFELDEKNTPNANATNTAAGIDQVSALGEATVTSEPATLLLWGTTAAGLGLAAWRRRRGP